MTNPSNARASENYSLGLIPGAVEAGVPMFYEPEVAAKLRAALEECHWFTHNASAFSYGVFIGFRGDDITAIANHPINPDIPDPTDPANAPAEDAGDPNRHESKPA